MLKIWKGKELEGQSKGVMTLFIMSDELVPINTMWNILYAHPDIKRVYFGAGLTEFVGFDKLKFETIAMLRRRGITTAIESTDTHKLSEATNFSERIWRAGTNYVTFPNDTLQIKFDNGNHVMCYKVSCAEITDLSTLKDNIFVGTDEILYNSEESK